MALSLSVQLPSWAGLRPLQRSAPLLHSPIRNPNLGRPFLLQIRMGGGPRTYPGGVTKWQWKKMQEKKGKQILKARLLRERQLYEMRKRAELKAAMASTTELEKPWEKTAPTLFSVTADEQLQTMADRFVKPGAVDLWTENDGPHHSLQSPDGKPSVRVFPKDALHSTRPYARVFHSSTDSGDARSARSETSDGRFSRSETSPEQATEYSNPGRERNASSNSGQREFSRVSTPKTVGFRMQDGKFRGSFKNSEKSEVYGLRKVNEGSNLRSGSGIRGTRGQDGKFKGNFQFSEKSELYNLGKGSEGSNSRLGNGTKGFRSQDGKFKGNFQHSKESELYNVRKGKEGSNSRPGVGIRGFRSHDGKFRGDFQYSEKPELYKLGKGKDGSISRRGNGDKGLGVSVKKSVGRIPRLYPQGTDYSSGKSNGYLQKSGVQSFAGFDLANGSLNKGRVGQSSNEDDDDYDTVDDGSELKSFI